ncbi:hypothetical protein, partial [Pseudomonas congelans]
VFALPDLRSPTFRTKPKAHAVSLRSFDVRGFCKTLATLVQNHLLWLERMRTFARFSQTALPGERHVR